MLQGAVLYEQGKTGDALNSYKESELAMSGTDDYLTLGLINIRRHHNDPAVRNIHPRLKRTISRNRQLERENQGLLKRVEDNIPQRTHLETMGRLLAMADALSEVYYRYGNTSGLDGKVRDVLKEFLGDSDKSKQGEKGSQEKVLELCEALCPGLIDSTRQMHPELNPRELLTIACTALRILHRHLSPYPGHQRKLSLCRALPHFQCLGMHCFRLHQQFHEKLIK